MTAEVVNRSPKVISVANQKGGVGKTTTSVNLAACLAAGGRRTLLVDLDPQGNASSGLGIDRHTSSTIYDVLIGRREIPECIQPTALENLFVIPSNQNLIGAEVELINAISREKKMKLALKKLPPEFEFVIFDCAPSLGLLTINAFTASESILIPTQCEYYAMEGLGQLLSTYQIVKEDLNEALMIEGVVLTMFDARNKLTHEVVKEMRSHFPDKLFATVIPRNVKLSESPSFGKPIILYDPESKGCIAYKQLAVEFVTRCGRGTLNFSVPPSEELAVVEEVSNVAAVMPNENLVAAANAETIEVTTPEVSQPSAVAESARVEVEIEPVNEGPADPVAVPQVAADEQVVEPSVALEEGAKDLDLTTDDKNLSATSGEALGGA